LEPKNDAFYYSRYRLTFLMREKTKEENNRAISDLHKASELAPNNAMYYKTLGDCYSPNLFINCENDEAKAYEFYSKAIQAEPANAQWYVDRANGYIGWILFSDKPAFFTDDNSLKDFNKAIDLDPSSAQAYTGRAALCSKQARELNKDEAIQAKRLYEKAAADYTKAIKIEPDNSEFYQERAKIYSSLADLLPYDDKDGKRPYYDKTIADITKAIANESKNYLLSSFYSRRAMCYNQIEEYDNEIADRSKAIELEPDNPSRYTDRARVYEELKKYDKAAEDYSKAIELDNTRAYYFSSRADTYLKQEMPEEAIADFTSAILLEPDSTRFLEARANVYVEMKQYEKAIADHTKAIELKPYASAYYARAKVYEAWGKYDDAVSDYRRSMEDDGTEFAISYNDLAYTAIARLYYETKNYLGVIKIYEEYVESGEAMGTVDLIWRGRAYFGLKEYKKAIDDYSRSIKLDDSRAIVFTNRASAYEAMGESALAEADRKTAEAIQLNEIGVEAYLQKDFITAEESFLQAYNLDKQRTATKNNLAFMKRRGETRQTTIPIADLISRDSQDGYVVINLALCYAKGFEYKESWDEAVDIVCSTESDLYGANHGGQTKALLETLRVM